MLHVRIKMRLGAWAVSSQNTDADTGVRADFFGAAGTDIVTDFNAAEGDMRDKTFPEIPDRRRTRCTVPAGFVRENLPGNPRTLSDKRFTMRETGSSLGPCAVELSGRSDPW